MRALPSTNSLQRLVIFIITCCVLWTQFFGLNHSINHAWNSTAIFSATPSISGISEQSRVDELTQKEVAADFADNSQSNSSTNHNCFAWDSCSLTTAVFLFNQIQFVNSLIFFIRAPKPLPIFSHKLPQYFLSRAPPQLPSR